MGQLHNHASEQPHQRRLQAVPQLQKHLLMLSSSKSAQNDAVRTLPGSADVQKCTSNIMAHNQPRRASAHQPSSSPQTMRRTVSNRSEPAGPLMDRVHVIQDPAAAHRLPSVSENGVGLDGVGMNPAEYCANISPQGQTYLDLTGTNLSSLEIYNGAHAPSTLPSMISASSAAEFSLPMTRENSLYGNTPSVNMTRLPSFTSQGPNVFSGQNTFPPTSVDNTPCPSAWKSTNSNNDLFAIGIRFSDLSPQQYVSFAENATPFLSTISATMERTDSTASARSTRSQRRIQEANRRVLENSKAVIAPKPQQGPTSDESQGIATANRDTVIMALDRPKYQRPKPDRVQCTLCNEHPDGFRGDHELRRHIKAKHEVVVTKFVCRDPASVGQHSSVRPRFQLSTCKACASGKQYGAYYNAAAHLRRTHFQEKAVRGRKKSPVINKRGGKGGGDWPPMSELKMWFYKVNVQVNQSNVRDAGNDAADDEENNDDASVLDVNTIDLDVPINPLHSGVNEPMGSHAFAHSFNLPFVQDLSAAPVLPSLDISPVSSGSTSFDYLAPSNQTDPEFDILSAVIYGAAPSANSSMSPAFHGLTLSEDMWDDMQVESDSDSNLRGF